MPNYWSTCGRNLELTLNGQQIQIVSSQNISRGGCFIDGQFGIVDGRVEEQIDQIDKSIKLAEVNSEVETDDEEEAGRMKQAVPGRSDHLLHARWRNALPCGYPAVLSRSSD